MRMRQDNGVHLFGIKRKRAAVQRFQCPGTLEETAIDQDAFSPIAEFHAGARDGARRTVKGERWIVRHLGLAPVPQSPTVRRGRPAENLVVLRMGDEGSYEHPPSLKMRYNTALAR